MKTILIYTSPARGHLYPIMDVATELKEQGNDVVIQTLAGEADVVKKAGLRHLPISSAIESLPLEDYKEKNPVSQIKSTFGTWLARAKYEIDDLKESRNLIKPHLLIIDVNTWGGGAYAESLEKPWAMFMPYSLPLSSPDTPAFGPGFPPPGNFLHRMRDRLFESMIKRAVSEQILELNKIRSELGVSALEEYENIFDHPDLILYRSAEPFDYQRKNMPANILPIGPGLWAPSGDEQKWVNDLPLPRILISVSTEKQDDSKIVETALRSMSEEEASLIITTGALDPQGFNTPNKRVKITEFLSHAQIIDKMDLLVTHGGMGATQRALAAGVPVFVIPCGRDQRETGRRAEVSESGIMLPKNKLNDKQFRKAVNEALKRKPGAVKIARAFASAGGARRGSDAISELIA